MSNLRPIRFDNLRPAPASLTPMVADRLVALADRLGAIRAEADRDARQAAERRSIARQFANVSNPLPVLRPVPRRAMPALPQDRRPFAISRDPCGRCGTRGDLGCEHQRPLEPFDGR